MQCPRDFRTDRHAAARQRQHERIRRIAVLAEQRREHVYRAGRAPCDLGGKTVILIDDGLATGLSMRAAIIAARSLGAAKVVAAVPVGEAMACQALAQPAKANEFAGRSDLERMGSRADEVVCMRMPDPFHAVGAWYGVFDPPSDDEVRDTLASWGRP
ncbi:phosphoribosyltransferase family protein [Variovorax sp. Varisp62]